MENSNESLHQQFIVLLFVWKVPILWFSPIAVQLKLYYGRGVPGVYSPMASRDTEVHCKLCKNSKFLIFYPFNKKKLNNQTNKKFKKCAYTLNSNNLFTFIHQKYLYVSYCMVQNLIFNPCDINSRDVRNCWYSIWSPKGALKFFQEDY